ncbi:MULTISPECIES: hypothetical protein [unclassified Ruminococcus]|uniref:hypothetical protein n=1 Tax=unclassified Ruminococcus TaxID=2608920 RepID=UPI00210CE261|nr:MULTISPECIES: hypothetical protein [unclassified Ruminococcus]MCQ4021662.1 hypothetical protein [Ruminococcus sp. zg-924]MCQ4114107.1 hypothetical protein [Ruminococcus sp. zg-921]
MKKNRLKKYSIRAGIAFLIIVAVLTYLSSTIDNMLLPKVKSTDIIVGTLSGENDGNMKTKYLLPLSSVTEFDESGSVFVLNTDDNGKTKVNEISVTITASDDLYYEVTSGSLFSDMQVIYETSKSISDGDRVYVEEG